MVAHIYFGTLVQSLVENAIAADEPCPSQQHGKQKLKGLVHLDSAVSSLATSNRNDHCQHGVSGHEYLQIKVKRNNIGNIPAASFH